MDSLTTLAIKHLLLRLNPLNRALRAAVDRQESLAAKLMRPDLAPLCITADQIASLLENIGALLKCRQFLAGPASLTPEEEEEEERLRESSRVANLRLPLDAMAQELELSPFEQEAVLLCAAPELDRSYEKIYAYILDDLNRRYPCVELLCTLTAAFLKEQLMRRQELSHLGKLRRLGVLEAVGDHPTELRQQLRLAPGLFDFLIGASDNIISLFRDRSEVALSEQIDLPPEVDQKTVCRLAGAMREGRLSVLGIWGSQHTGHEDLVHAIAGAAEKRLRVLNISDLQQPGMQPEDALQHSIQIASALNAMLWVQTDALTGPEQERQRDALANALANTDVPIVFTGIYPWRPTRLLEARNYMEVELSSPTYNTRKQMWARLLPEVDETRIDSLAGRFRLNNLEMRAVARLARTNAELSNGAAPRKVGDFLDAACSAVTRKRSDHFASVVKVKRGPLDLILPDDLHKQVIEIAHFFKAWPRVDEEWGFGRLITGGGGIKALFTGEPGTGKTLAAEVIAGILNLPLLKVDLARVVSKWVGETEKNLETVFREAEESHSVLLFDEADSLFGHRGEVRHGADRYANLEVGYLLQRLEDFYGLVILSSNLKDQIDSAFTRRFQVIISFPFPGPEERIRIWKIAFPPLAPLDPSVNLASFKQVELTGAGIVSVARTAALLAIDGGEETITTSQIVRAIARQYRREGRILTRSELGPNASLLQGTK